MTCRALVLSGALAVLAPSGIGAGEARAAGGSVSASQISARCVSFYAGELANLKSNCGKIGRCFAVHLRGVTISQFSAVARHNLSGSGQRPARAETVAAAEQVCARALPSLAAYVDGVAGDT